MATLKGAATASVWSGRAQQPAPTPAVREAAVGLRCGGGDGGLQRPSRLSSASSSSSNRRIATVTPI